MKNLPVYFSFILLGIVFLIVLPFFYPIHAQQISAGGQPGGEFGVSQNSPFPFDGAWDIDTFGEYRIEVGVNGEDDSELQYNLNITENTACRPANFGGDEPNKSAGALTVFCDTIQSQGITAVDMSAYLSISSLNLTPGETYSLKLKRGRSGNDTVNTLNLQVLESEPSISLNPSRITSGTSVTATVTNLAQNTTYTAYLTLEDGAQSSRSKVEFSTGTGNGCTTISGTGVFRVGSCPKNNSSITTRITINTTGYNCSPRGERDQNYHTCKVNIASPDPSRGSLTSADLEVSSDTSKPTIDLEPGTIYEDTEVNVTVNCPVGTETFNFTHQIDPDKVDWDEWRQNTGNSKPDALTYYREQSYSDNSFPIDIEYKDPQQVGVVCSPSGLTSDWIDLPEIEGTGGDSAEVSVDQPLSANTSFTVNMSGLQQGNCYYYKILTSGGQPILPNESGSIIDCGDENFHDHMRDRDAFKASDTWGAAFNSPVDSTYNESSGDSGTGLPIGIYSVELHEILRTPGLLDDDRIQDTFPFCVGLEEGDECDAEAILNPPPPKPPCAHEIGEDGKCNAVNTAFGEFSVEPGTFVTRLLGILLGIAGGIAVLIIILAGYRFMTSSGNPEAIQEARERLTSAIVGLLFIIFSIVILQVIGVDILRLPGFGA